MQFGLWSAKSKETKVAWGARGIIEQGGVSLLHDRQSSIGPEEEKQEFVRYLNSGPMKKMFSEVKRLLKTRKMRADTNERFTLYENDKCRIVGNTNASYGYLYLLAEKKEVPCPRNP